mmetsp:Transcript_23170/g.43000  ORF Transcript_23170/g.43000 Transcript_23170/m.43000 type:complete len:181 (+) Transcript_23170:63-605(+)
MASSKSLPSSIDEIDHDIGKALNDKKQRRVGRFLSVKFADALLDWFIFPALLFVQFGATMYCQQKQGLLIMDSKLVFSAVALFCLFAIAYRKVYRVHPIQSLVLLLLPEVFTNVVLATVMFAGLKIAFETMNVLTAVMAALAGVGSVQLYQYAIQHQPEAGDYERLHQEEDEDSDDEWVC